MVDENSTNESAKADQIEQTIVFDSAATHTVSEKKSDSSLSFELPSQAGLKRSGSGAEQEGGNLPGLPEEFGRYLIRKTLGEGAMGTVYLALDTQLDRQVALKVPKFKPGHSERFIKRFYREAQSAATLAHPNICSVFDVGIINDTHYIAMAFIQGHALADYIRQGKVLTQRSCAMVIRKIALALDEAHSKGVIHRDVKPANIMIDQRNEPIVMDFGLAQRESDEAEARLTQDGSIIGSPAYMSPEQVAGKPEDVGPASDIYGLGVVLFELLAGRVPFRGKGSITSIIAEILTDDPPALGELRADIDAKLAAICEKAIARNPEDRFASMKEFADALMDYLKSPDSAATVSSGRPTVADVEAVRIQEQISLIRTLCSQGQNSAAVSILEKIISTGKPGSKYVKWAEGELPRIKAIMDRAAIAASLASQRSANNDPLGLTSNDPLGVPATDPLGRPAHTSSTVLRGPTPFQRPRTQILRNDDQIPRWMWYVIAVPILAISIGVLAMMLSSAFRSDETLAQNDGKQSGEIVQQENGDGNHLPADDVERPDSSDGDNPTGRTSTGVIGSKTGAENPNSEPDPNWPEEPANNENLPPPRGLPMPVHEVFEQFDVDRDDVLSDYEIPPYERRFFLEADEDRDGMVSRKELEALDRAIRDGEVEIPDPRSNSRIDEPRRLANRLFEQHDDDQDEKLDRRELPPYWSDFFDRVDMNDDRLIDRSEIEKSADILRDLRGIRDRPRLGPRGEKDPSQRRPNGAENFPIPLED